MKSDRIKKYGITVIMYLVLAVAFYLIGGEQLRSISVKDSRTEAMGVIPEFSMGQILEQEFTAEMDRMETVEFMTATYARQNQGELYLQLKDRASGEVLSEQRVDVSAMADNTVYTWILAEPVEDARRREMVFCMESFCEPGQAITVYYGEAAETEEFTVNGQTFAGQLYLNISGKNYSLFGMHYWLWVTFVGLIIIAYMLWTEYQDGRGKITKGRQMVLVWQRYRFLIEQLVARDFKTKYKRSVLGYLWSFLNPLLTMMVQYIVFSTIFRSGIENYPVYLLTGIILFNFFSEAVGQGLCSIVYNASLITKVYVPKYIYPVTKVASTSINLFISIIPLLLVTIITGVKITSAILLLPFVLACLLLFCLGMVLMLCAAMVFFRDTQYLWGIISMVWMYATPLFYPENIIPARFKFIQTLNPMYHIIKFARTIFIEGISPAPGMYGACIVSAVVTCIIGAFIFKKTQNKFVLYI